MNCREVDFYSDAIRLRGAYYSAQGPAQDDSSTSPVVIVCSGYTGLRNIHPERFARALTPRGHTVFGFDYRGHAPSDGEKGHLLLEDQIRDIANAVRKVRSDTGRPVVLAGWGMGGGLVLEASRLVGKLLGLICINGFYDAIRVQKAVRGDEAWQDFAEDLRQQQMAAVNAAEPVWIDPFFAYPLDPVSQVYVDNVLRKDPQFAPDVTLDFADSLLRFKPERVLDHLAETPLLIAHGADNALHPPEEARSLQARYPGKVKLHWLAEAGHTEWMLDEHPIFQGLVTVLDAWLSETC